MRQEHISEGGLGEEQDSPHVEPELFISIVHCPGTANIPSKLSTCKLGFIRATSKRGKERLFLLYFPKVVP